MAAANSENVIPKLHELAFEVFFDKIVHKSTVFHFLGGNASLR